MYGGRAAAAIGAVGHAAVYHEQHAARAPVGLRAGDAASLSRTGAWPRAAPDRGPPRRARQRRPRHRGAGRTHGQPPGDAGGHRWRAAEPCRSRSALARVADPITSPDGEDTTRDAGATQLNNANKGRPRVSAARRERVPTARRRDGRSSTPPVAPHTHHVARVLLRTARTRRHSDFETSFNPLENDDRPRSGVA